MSISVPQAQLFFLALTRILAVIIQVPVLGGTLIPNPVKIGFGCLLAIIMLPWQPLPPDAPILPVFAFSLSIGREMLIGTLAGFAAALVFAALQIAGEMIGLGSGFAAGRIINPAFENTGSSVNQFFFMVAVVLFLVIDGHHDFLIGLQRTFTLLPLNNPLPELSAERLISLTGGLITAGVQMALPVMGTLLLTDLTLGLLSRVAPQVHVFFLGIPLKVGIGLLALMLTLNLSLPTLSKMYSSIAVWMLELLGG